MKLRARGLALPARCAGACALAVVLVLVLVLAAKVARAEEISSVRAASGVTVGPALLAWDAGVGIAWLTAVDDWGIRLGSNVGMLSYPKAGESPAFLTLTPEASLYFGAETDLRVFYTLELASRIFTLDARYTRPWAEAWFLGVRSGVELSQHVRSLALQLRAGLFLSALRDEHERVQPGVGLRIAIEYGAPLVPAPTPLPNDRLCPDGTPKLPGMPCP